MVPCLSRIQNYFRILKVENSHKVLNAKFHEHEADIVAQAGKPGAVMIATNMAGRGTDIVLGGNWQAEVEKIENPIRQNREIKAEWKESRCCACLRWFTHYWYRASRVPVLITSFAVVRAVRVTRSSRLPFIRRRTYAIFALKKWAT